MKVLKIKSEWASININQDNSVTVCAKKNGSTQCIRFDSLDELKKGIDKRRIVIKKWALSIPRSLCFLKTLSFPASNFEEALSMIEFELPTVIPLSMDEIMYGTTFLNQHEHMLEVLVSIVKQNTLNDYLNPLKAIGIEPKKIILSSLAIQNWININSNSTKEPVISVIIDNDNNCVVQTSIQGNFQKETVHKHTQNDLVDKIFREILQQRESLDISIRDNITYVLTGIEEYVSKIKDLLSSIEHESGIVDRIVIVPSPEIINFNNESEKKGMMLNSEAIISTGLLDLAINLKLNDSNLISRQSARKYSKNIMQSQYIMTGIFCIAFIFFLWLYLFISTWRIERISGLIEAEIDPIKDIAISVDKKRQQVRAVQNQFNKRGRLTEIICELYKYTPDTISISKLSYTSKQSKIFIDIRGQADLFYTPFYYMEDIASAKLLNGMQVRDTQMIQQVNGSVVIFKANCEIRGE